MKTLYIPPNLPEGEVSLVLGGNPVCFQLHGVVECPEGSCPVCALALNVPSVIEIYKSGEFELVIGDGR